MNATSRICGYGATGLELQYIEWTAKATIAMAATGIGALILSTVGVILVFRTLKATREAANAAALQLSSFKNTERGFLTGHIQFGVAQDDGSVRVSCLVANRGKAKVEVIEVHGQWQSDLTIPDTLPRHVADPIWVEPEKWKSVSCPIITWTEQDDLDHLIIEVRYRDQFGDKHSLWLAGSLTEIVTPSEEEVKFGGDPTTHKFRDLTQALVPLD
ncbi:hypothetical protein ACFCW2_03050 [Qipengyuania sp. DSG2-2]|uniref:hypothetical protein n=1 Tax=Qipengyuania sp. DGS2-2 TaxID=3349631 RepID=UPI0036D35522